MFLQQTLERYTEMTAMGHLAKGASPTHGLLRIVEQDVNKWESWRDWSLQVLPWAEVRGLLLEDAQERDGGRPAIIQLSGKLQRDFSQGLVVIDQGGMALS